MEGSVQTYIYKYMGADVFELALNKDGICSFKCSYPKDFNDPYELFLTIDFQQSPELLATYQDTIGELPQKPTTCFSKSPNVIPMWAHYAHGHRGIVLEFNETLFLEHFPEVGFGDVKYRDSADGGLLDTLARACHIGKPRYHYMLQRGVFSAAYFTKHSHWSYEQERRLVTEDEQVKMNGEIMLLEFPAECINSVIVGNRASDKTKEFALQISSEIGANYLEIKTSKLSSEPYFIDQNNLKYRFKENEIKESKFVCDSCDEPLDENLKLCSWCSIEKHHIEDAAIQNPLRMLQDIGQLESYYKSMNEIGKK